MRGVTLGIELEPADNAKFQLTRLMRGVTANGIRSSRNILRFQLTRLMRGVTLDAGFDVTKLGISTHTPHARRDNTSSIAA